MADKNKDDKEKMMYLCIKSRYSKKMLKHKTMKSKPALIMTAT